MRVPTCGGNSWSIFLCESSSFVCYAHRAVGACGDMDGMSLVLAVACRTFRIGNELGRSIVVSSTFKGIVGLPKILETWSRADGCPSRRACALFCTVIHDCDA